jgi:hypothetical protein
MPDKRPRPNWTTTRAFHQAAGGEERASSVNRGDCITLVSRFRRSYPFAARARTNVGTKGTLATI